MQKRAHACSGKPNTVLRQLVGLPGGEKQETPLEPASVSLAASADAWKSIVDTRILKQPIREDRARISTRPVKAAKYLVDTDWIIDHTADMPLIVQTLTELQPKGLAISIVSLGKLYKDVYTSRDAAGAEVGIRSFLTAGVVILPLDDKVCRLFGRERAKLLAARRMIGDLGLLIGCTTMRHGLTLLTKTAGISKISRA